MGTLAIHTENTQPNRTYVNGWYGGELFEFTYHFADDSYHFGEQPFIDGAYRQAMRLEHDEAMEIARAWAKRYFHSFPPGYTPTIRLSELEGDAQEPGTEIGMT